MSVFLRNLINGQNLCKFEVSREKYMEENKMPSRSKSWVLSPFTLGLFLLTGLILAVLAIELPRRFANQNLTKPNALAPLEERQKASFPREITDASGAVLTIPTKPQRIVSQTLGTDEILLEICESSRIIALNQVSDDPKYSNIVEKAKQVKGRVIADAEQILQMKPDIIFVASFSKAEMVELLQTSKAPVFRFANFDTLADIKNNIRTVGFAIGEDEKAENLVKQMEREIAEIQQSLPKNSAPPRVMSYGESGYTAGANTLFDDMLKTIGAVNLTAEKGLKGFPKISAEQLIEWNPDFIVTSADEKDLEQTRENLLKNAAVAVTKAGKNRRVIVVKNRDFLSVTHHITTAIKQLATEIYGK